jgi:predicted regulator of Ras-like GTPase activity (Roadblock/LC7/MglB family)
VLNEGRSELGAVDLGASIHAGLDQELLDELASLPYVKAVLITDEQRLLNVILGPTSPAPLTVSAALARGALERLGSALTLGSLQVSASVFDAGVVVLSCVGALGVAVLADAGANLGSLLNYLRRVHRSEVMP